MATVTWLLGADSTVMSTELNSLANLSQAIASSAYDNSAQLYLFADVELDLAALSYSPSAGAVVELYLIRELLTAGSGFEDGNASIAPPAANLVGVFNIRPSAAAQTHILRQIPIPPSQYKWLVINKMGLAFAASGNLLRQKPYTYQTT